jgi:NAD(P)-dependent dehydrogenase (short-subunit alcohol dehydrogenase family)
MKYDDLFRLDGKVAVVTGSTKGIGRATAEALAAQGAKVVISSRKADVCEAVAQAITADGGTAVAIPANINDDGALENLVTESRKAFGQIDILVCNAALNPYFGPLSKLPDDAYHKTMDGNVRSNILLCNLVIPEMAERKDGAVVIISSVAGLKGSSNIGLYGITKAADAALTRNLAVEWGPSNVRVNCLAPAIIRTDMARALWENPDIYNASVRQYPLRRIGEVQEVAGAAVFLASEAGRFITGHTLVIDGGSTISTEM